MESFLPSQEQYLSYDLQNAFRDAKFWNIPILIGSNNLEVFKGMYAYSVRAQLPLSRHLLFQDPSVRYTHPSYPFNTYLFGFQDDWMELMNNGFNDLYQVVSSEIQALIKLRIGNITPDIDMLNFVTELIKWKYLGSRSSKDKTELLGEVQQLYSQVLFDAPIFQIIQLMSSASQPVYVYRFSYTSSMDLTQRPINFSGKWASFTRDHIYTQ